MRIQSGGEVLSARVYFVVVVTVVVTVVVAFVVALLRLFPKCPAVGEHHWEGAPLSAP